MPRVVSKNGSLGGYRWGVKRKHALLEREKTIMTAPLKKTPAARALRRPRIECPPSIGRA